MFRVCRFRSGGDIVRSARHAVAAGLGLAVLLGCGGAARGDEALTAEFYHDFRGNPMPKRMTYVNPAGGKFFQFGAEGMRITLPESYIHSWGGVGVRTVFKFGGDFEVTATCEVLEAETPPSGYGVGAVLAIGSPDGMASIGRLVRANGKPIILWNQEIQSPEKKSDFPEDSVPGAAKVVRLRLKRSGKMLHFLWAPGETGGEFQTIAIRDYGVAEVERVRLAAVTGQKPRAVDIRLLDLRIRSEKSELPTAMAGGVGQPDIPGAEARSGWRIWSALALVIAVGLGVVFAVRRSGAARKAGAAVPEPATARPTSIALVCPGCEKNLKVNAHLAGKKVKCPQCEEVVQVPE